MYVCEEGFWIAYRSVDFDVDEEPYCLKVQKHRKMGEKNPVHSSQNPETVSVAFNILWREQKRERRAIVEIIPLKVQGLC